MSDYSQHGEQAVILDWAQGQRGNFLDLGCYDGISYSNTAALADLGWPGICVDAAPDAASACADRYRERADVEVVLAAFDAEGGNAPALLHWTPGAMYTSLLPGRRLDRVKTPILIPRLDLDWLTERVASRPRPFFCSIDLEGDSIEAFEWVIDHLEPDCICVEANNSREQRIVAGRLFGWTALHVNASNSIFAREPVAA